MTELPGPKVLIIRLSSLGDVVLATAAVEALHRAQPAARISVLTKPAFREVFRDHPGVAELVPWRPEEGVFALARQIRRERFDWVIDLHHNLRTVALRGLVHNTRWSVYHKGVWRRRLAVWLRRPGLLGGQPHVVDRYLGALAPLGVGDERCLPRVYPSAAERERVQLLLREAGWDGARPCIALAPGARWATKAWPEEHWRDLVAKLVDQPGKGFPVLVGGSGEVELCRRILGAAGGAILAGETGILETAAALEQCGVLVTNDSAPLHLATAVGTPVIALFGPTVRGFGFWPPGPDDTLVEVALSCRPCSLHGDDRCSLGTHDCLVRITPYAILSQLGNQRRVGGIANSRREGVE